MKHFALLFVVALALVSCLNARAEESKKFVLVTMDSQDEHWLKVKEGAEKKAAELGGIEISFRAPAGKVDPNEQMRMVEDAINQEADAILLAPSDKAALAGVVENAVEASIPVVIIDSPVDAEGYVTFLATDNYMAGALAAERLAHEINQKGKVAIINAQPGAGTAIAREKGFVDHMKKYFDNIDIIAIQYSNGDKVLALNQATDILNAHPDLAGFYACNEGSTVGVSRAIEEQGVAGKVKVVGFDMSKDVISAIENGLIQASAVQNPYKMGFDGVQAAADAIAGKKVVDKIDTGVVIVGKDELAKVNK